MKVVKIDDIIDFCEAQISHLYARHETIALAQLRGVKEFCKDSAVDVQPVMHGRWTDNVYKYVKSLDAYFIQAKCSVCGRYSDRIDIYSRFMSSEYCSRCGARMDGEQNV